MGGCAGVHACLPTRGKIDTFIAIDKESGHFSSTSNQSQSEQLKDSAPYPIIDNCLGGFVVIVRVGLAAVLFMLYQLLVRWPTWLPLPGLTLKLTSSGSHHW